MNTLETIKSFQDIYIPGQQVEAHLASRSGLVLVGPMAVGKTTLINYIPTYDEDFAAATAFTTRLQRPSETTSLDRNLFRYLPSNESTHLEILEKIINGSLVDFAIHPTTGSLYGSEIRDYQHEYMLLDRLHVAAERTVQLPFRDIAIATILAEPESWKERFKHRKQEVTKDEIAQRLEEGCSSLEWAMSKNDMNWVMNPKRKVIAAMLELIQLGRFGYGSESATRTDAEKLLDTIQSERAKL